MADGFFGQFGQNLGQGLSTAGEILSPRVYEEVARQRQMQLANQLALQRGQRELAARAIIAGVQSGSIEPQIGRQKLAQLGMGDIPVGPSLEAQGTKAFMDWQGGGGGMPAPQGTPALPWQPVPASLGMSPTPGFTMPPAAAAASPLYGRYIEAQRAQLEAERARREAMKPVVRTRVQGDQEIQEQQDPNTGQWTEIGRGPRFARQVAPTIRVGGEGEKGWVLGTVNGEVVRQNANLGVAQKQQPDGSWVKAPISPDFVPTTASTAGQATAHPDISDEKLKSMSWQDLTKFYKLPIPGHAMQLAAMDYYLTDKLPYMGFSGKGSAGAARLALISGRAKIADELGVSPEVAVSMPAQWKANAVALNKMQVKKSQLDAIMGSFHNNISTWESVAQGKPPQLSGDRIAALGNAFKAIDFSDVNALNKAKLAINTQFSDPATVAYVTGAVTVAMDYARILSSQGQSAAQVSDSARTEATRLINVGYNKNAREALIGTLESDTAGQLKGLNDSIERTKGRMQDVTGGAAKPETTAAKPTTGTAPQKALDYLKAHPETKDAFKTKYGYLPSGY